ncbi:ethanolamine ammonia-lyase subunit EutC [Allomuricauda sp. NBRC 101325]|uniref:ethanolamine ammonia-lyase subunit EutC n=1 Tax=Allomuricauda sp. NBRC 101325 TaxID=1113758 RepID=UPI0024A4E5F0|nr:ethanolamine ammonia-lyase subunit EutC [Muricauda sp. NBRC 101325]GLU43503.1 ethanolamine ammonia-lyase light chain [Muricauda sp. NBRC 101325]
MNSENNIPIKKDPWEDLKTFTNARIALGSTGNAIPLDEVLQFRFAHAKAKDAIESELNIDSIKEEIESWGFSVWEVKSQVSHRDEYLQRPDLGRKLDEISEKELQESPQEFDLVFVIADGLSANAINKNAIPLLKELLPKLEGYKIGFVLAKMARVALSDPIGILLKAKFVAMCIGERPGLSSPESMGIYTTYAPQLGLTDERRNCISNIHSNGLNSKEGTALLFYLIRQSFDKKISGVDIKINLKDLLED